MDHLRRPVRPSGVGVQVRDVHPGFLDRELATGEEAVQVFHEPGRSAHAPDEAAKVVHRVHGPGGEAAFVGVGVVPTVIFRAVGVDLLDPASIGPAGPEALLLVAPEVPQPLCVAHESPGQFRLPQARRKLRDAPVVIGVLQVPADGGFQGIGRDVSELVVVLQVPALDQRIGRRDLGVAPAVLQGLGVIHAADALPHRLRKQDVGRTGALLVTRLHRDVRVRQPAEMVRRVQQGVHDVSGQFRGHQVPEGIGVADAVPEAIEVRELPSAGIPEGVFLVHAQVGRAQNR